MSKVPNQYSRWRKRIYWRNPDKIYFKIIQWRYKLSKKDYYKIIKNQNNKCPICNTRFKSIYKKQGKRRLTHVDHDHKTGKVRGILCQKCNVGLHYFENKKFIRNAIKYLSFKPSPHSNKNLSRCAVGTKGEYND